MASTTKNPPTLPFQPPADSATKPFALGWRLLISAVILFHLIAVIIAPTALLFPSNMAVTVRQWLSPYLDVAYLDHGYQFFAPEPGPSHLVRYKLELPNGDFRRGEFPDLNSQWPRQFYHRHFMLSEKLTGLYPPPLTTPPPEASMEEIRRVRAEHAQVMSIFERFARSYAQQLMRTAGAKRIHIELVEHAIAPPERVASEGLRLNDPSSYRVIWQADYEADPS